MVNDPRYIVADPRYTIAVLHILSSHTVREEVVCTSNERSQRASHRVKLTRQSGSSRNGIRKMERQKENERIMWESSKNEPDLIVQFLRTKTRCLEENEEKHGRKENPERKKKIKERPLWHL